MKNIKTIADHLKSILQNEQTQLNESSGHLGNPANSDHNRIVSFLALHHGTRWPHRTAPRGSGMTDSELSVKHISDILDASGPHTADHEGLERAVAVIAPHAIHDNYKVADDLYNRFDSPPRRSNEGYDDILKQNEELHFDDVLDSLTRHIMRKPK